MKVGYLQFGVQFGLPETNRERIRSLLGDESFDLLVLPELCLSGYFMPSREYANSLSTEHGAGKTFAFFRELAARHNGAVIFGYPERAGDKLFNSCAAVLPDGSAYLYRKVHLFNREKIWFDPGDRGQFW